MFKEFKFSHKNIKNINIPMELVIENYRDFEHVSYVHKRCFKYSNLVKRSKNLTLLEYGVFHIPPIPIAADYIMLHEFIPPNKIIHLSRRNNSRKFVKGEVIFEEKNGGTQITQYHKTTLPFYFKPFVKILIFLLDRWSNIVWEEDSGIMLDRYKFLKSGNKDGSHCGKWIVIDGRPKWEFHKRTEEN